MGGGGGGGRGRERGGRSRVWGRGAPDIDPLPDHSYLVFGGGVGSGESPGFYRLRHSESTRDCLSCYKMFEFAYPPLYRVLVIEFLSSFEFSPRPADHPEEDDDPDHPWVEVNFRLGGE
ncbi:hypothetical protein Hanom_Chr02g00148751 [Helianthus anomalus]